MYSENIDVLVGKPKRENSFGTQRNSLWMQRGGYCHKESEINYEERGWICLSWSYEQGVELLFP